MTRAEEDAMETPLTDEALDPKVGTYGAYPGSDGKDGYSIQECAFDNVVALSRRLERVCRMQNAALKASRGFLTGNDSGVQNAIARRDEALRAYADLGKESK